jgi:isocitrate/isopropylmalate dehydrogenase
MMLRHLKMEEHALNIEEAVLKTIADGKVRFLD